MTQVIEKKTLGKRECARIYKEADAAGSAAAEAAVPTPMIVGTPTTPLGNDIDFKKHGWTVKVAELLSMPSQKVRKWMMKWSPDLLEGSHQRK